MNNLFCEVIIFRSSRSQMFFKIDVLKNFASFTGKHRCYSLSLIKLQVFRPATLLKRDSNTGAFSVKFVNFLRTPFFAEHLQWLFLGFLQQNSLIFSVIRIILGCNQKIKNCHGHIVVIFTLLFKNIHFLSEARPSSPNILQPFPSKSKLHDTAKHLCLYNRSIFEGEWCVPQ